MVCIPAYNEAKNIASIIQKAKKYTSDVIVYDDGSIDGTAKVAQECGATVLRNVMNRGNGAAIKELCLAAKTRNADVIVTWDSDGQHDPDQIPEIIVPVLSNGFDMAIGSRFLKIDDKKRVPLFRRFGIRVITKLSHIISYSNITDAQNGFRAYSRRAFEEMELKEDGMSISIEILMRAKEKGLTIKEVPISVNYRVDAPSTYNIMLHGIGLLSSLLRFIIAGHCSIYRRHHITQIIMASITLITVIGQLSNMNFLG
jgi:glycosyltransferase involved in cell wall biosynthesis